jgi:hypothetical protein
LEDIGMFEKISSFPFPVRFWRRSEESIARRRNPLFCEWLGITPERTFTVDVLHALHLGVFLNFCRFAVWELMLGGAFGCGGTIDETVSIAILQIRHALGGFYRAHDRENPGAPLTRISRFSKRLVGTPSDRKLSTKGAETWGFLLFLRRELAHRQSASGPHGPQMLRAASCLVRLYEGWTKAGTNLKRAEVQASFDAWNGFLRASEGMELRIPKRHLVAHLLERLPFWGNPRGFAAWVDEALNRDLKASCRAISQATFEPFLLLRMRHRLRKLAERRDGD